MMKFKLAAVALIGLFCFGTGVSFAKTEAADVAAKAVDESDAWTERDQVEGNLKRRYPNTPFKNIKKTPLPGIYQMTMGKNVGYVEVTGRYFIFGRLFDMQTQTDLTEEPKAEANKVVFDKLPLDNAIKIKKGNGKRVFAVFTDPDCPYCKQFESTMLRMNDYTMYVFLMPIASLHPGAQEKSKNIWCAKNKAQAWSDWMLDSILAPAASANCKTPIEENIKLGEEMGANGTPTLIRADGALTAGALPKPDLEDWLNKGVKP